jgi:hypothetical protein
VTGSGSNAGCANGGLEFTAYSVRTGKLVRVLCQYRGACHNGLSTLLWTDDSARYIIGATMINVASQGGKQAAQLGVITNARGTPSVALATPAQRHGITRCWIPRPTRRHG